MDRSEQIKLCIGYYWIMRTQSDTMMLFLLVTLYMYIRNRRRGYSSIGRRVNTLPLRRDALDNIIGAGGDRNCIWELRMSLNAFANLCELLQVQGGLDDDGHVGIGEQVATFLIILAHHTKNRSVQVRFYRSGETVSRYFHKVLGSVLRVQSVLFAKADPVPEDSIDPRWKWFKGCLGALDGTYIDVTVPKSDKSRYRTRKSRISTNRCFGLLKKRWAILRSPSFYPIRIQSHIIIACCLLQNFIRMNMDVDPEEDATLLPEHIPVGDDTVADEADMIDAVESSHEWTQWREDLATEMWEIWRAEHDA
ncbi:uncharacterized protein LOC130957232 [Arachis stenosperma]|uniref:uncharacterized protein LOC130957232 n=1 Tax=Arachis stenosperma TaxID=217475 RepID=UPI0025AC4021|nr:uncharacterized protein LOC130957232 [Arachis stenosperma]